MENDLDAIETAMLMLVDNLTHEQRLKLIRTVFPHMNTFTSAEARRMDDYLHIMDAFVIEALNICDGSSGLGALGAQKVKHILDNLRTSVQVTRNVFEHRPPNGV